MQYYINTLAAQFGQLPGTAGRRIHFHSTFFFTKLTENGFSYEKVRRWTRGIDVFTNDLIIIPVNVKNTHWYLAVINLRHKRTEIYDSDDPAAPGAAAGHVHEILMRYLKEEHMDKKRTPLDEKEWTRQPPGNHPQQSNKDDCGVFTLMTIFYMCHNAIVNFSQRDMPRLRRWLLQQVLKDATRRR
jgi:sentrin-specific protease 1